jgi:hypothetical protein
MGKTKNRNYTEPKKDQRLSLRLNSVLLDELKNKSNQQSPTKAIDEAIKDYLTSKRDTTTDYICEKCNKKMLKQEMYYCNLDQLEIRMDDEIIVTKSEPIKILCISCAKKDNKILEFIESEDDCYGTFVAESDR